MLDASEALGRSLDPPGLRAALRVPPEYTAVRYDVVNGVAIQESKGEISEEAIRAALSRILESSIFARSRRLSRFLRFTVEATLAGEEETLKEYLIGTEVYERKPSYDPTEDSIVRTEAHRLRSKLKKYYESIGTGDPVVIYYRPGSYVPVFRSRHSQNGSGIVKAVAPGELFLEEPGIRVAVLPFVDASRGNLSSACAQIITDELIHELVRTDGLRVTAASLVAAQPRDIPAIARTLDVQIVFDGTVRQNQNQLRVVSRIINADGFQIWSERLEADADPHGLFKLSEKIVSALILALFHSISQQQTSLHEETLADTQLAIGPNSRRQEDLRMRNKQRSMSIALMILSLAAGALAQEIKTDYDRNADFSRYKTFSFEKVETKDALWVDRITAAVGAALAAKGLTQVASDGDIAIVAIGMTQDRQTVNTFYDNFGGGWGWRRWGGGDFGEATTTTETYKEGTLVVDLFDSKSKALLWRGSASNILSNNSTKNIKDLDKSVEKLFRKFPPKA